MLTVELLSQHGKRPKPAAKIPPPQPFFLSNSPQHAIVQPVKRAGARMGATAAPVLCKVYFLEFTLPMLVIRNYVLEP